MVEEGNGFARSVINGPRKSLIGDLDAVVRA